MKTYGKLAIFFMALIAAGAVHAQSFKSKPSAKPVGVSRIDDTYPLTCPETAASGCSLVITIVLPDGNLATEAWSEILPGHTEHLLKEQVVSGLTAMIPN